MKTITSGDIIRACKKANGIEVLLNKFEYESQEDLFDAIKKIFPVAADHFIRKLKGTVVKRKTSKDDVAIIPEKAEDTVDLEAEERNEKMEFVVDNVPSEKMTGEFVSESVSIENSEDEVQTKNATADIEDTATELETLKAMESTFSKDVIALEGEHKKVCNTKAEVLKKLENAKKALEELKRILAFQENNVLELSKSFFDCEDKMQDINNKKAEFFAKLSEVRNQIASLEKITILVYKDATFYIENAETPEIEEAEYANNFSKFFALPDVGELTVNEIKTLSKLLEIVKHYEKRTYEVVFDNPKAQQVWEKFNS